MPWKSEWIPVIGQPLPKKITNRLKIIKNHWFWKGAHSQGYAQTSSGGKPLYLHRVVYESLVGKIPDGYEIDHTCRIRGCVNPKHLEAVTSLENLKRQHAAYKHPATCKRGHPFIKKNRRPVRNGTTSYCIICRRENYRKGK